MSNDNEKTLQSDIKKEKVIGIARNWQNRLPSQENTRSRESAERRKVIGIAKNWQNRLPSQENTRSRESTERRKVIGVARNWQNRLQNKKIQNLKRERGIVTIILNKWEREGKHEHTNIWH